MKKIFALLGIVLGVLMLAGYVLAAAEEVAERIPAQIGPYQI